jgi:DNA-directed RNA polymerase specialized sigma subunit
MPDPLAHYGLVVHLARKRHASVRHLAPQIDLDDLIQEGLVGLLAAARRWA